MLIRLPLNRTSLTNVNIVSNIIRKSKVALLQLDPLILMYKYISRQTCRVFPALQEDKLRCIIHPVNLTRMTSKTPAESEAEIRATDLSGQI